MREESVRRRRREGRRGGCKEAGPAEGGRANGAAGLGLPGRADKRPGQIYGPGQLAGKAAPPPRSCHSAPGRSLRPRRPRGGAGRARPRIPGIAAPGPAPGAPGRPEPPQLRSAPPCSGECRRRDPLGPGPPAPGTPEPDRDPLPESRCPRKKDAPLHREPPSRDQDTPPGPGSSRSGPGPPGTGNHPTGSGTPPDWGTPSAPALSNRNREPPRLGPGLP
ncbi:cuticle collagen 2C-like [Myiozetetes cayanensis]|uniref:cuticle collagen 2C-like n=1 Tax=Myiozetetes cayanensis TaxID=478635 RepID=UPI00215E9A89|nr:cuticle collagen 2C-like [Myiozetetes cayanensis]